MPLGELEEAFGIYFDDTALLKTAFVHRSYLNEHPDFKLPSNERLEFLGDAVLQFLTSSYLYNNYKTAPEGALTNYRAALVCTRSLAETARELNLGKFLFLSRGENDSGGRDREYILANTFEALLGAIYIDKGPNSVDEFLRKTIFIKLNDIIENKKYKDYKSNLQEITQDKVLQTPVYKILKEWGPDHDKNFLIAVLIKNKIIGKGTGSSKQKAEQAAAKEALKKLEH